MHGILTLVFAQTVKLKVKILISAFSCPPPSRAFLTQNNYRLRFTGRHTLLIMQSIEDFQIKCGANHHKIIIPLMEQCLLNLHVLHCAVIPLWDRIMMKILFRYSLIIS